jgi:Uma2 family endonuclease
MRAKLAYSDIPVSPDGRRYELVRGELYVTASPSPLHQRVSKRLQVVLMAYFEGRALGEVFDAPIDLLLTDHDVLVPDLLVVADPKLVSDRAIEGPPLLVVEILSPSTRLIDQRVKARCYAKHEVLHYWLVDPDRQRVECFELNGQIYRSVAHVEGEDVLKHPTWPDLTVDLGALWR